METKVWTSYYSHSRNGYRCNSNVEPEEVLVSKLRSKMHKSKEEAFVYYRNCLREHARFSGPNSPEALIKKMHKYGLHQEIGAIEGARSILESIEDE